MCHVPESATPTGTGEPSLVEVTFGWRTPENGPDPRFGKVDVSGDGAGTNATEPPRMAGRFAGRSEEVERAEARVCHPNWRIGAAVLTAPVRCPGLARSSGSTS